MKTANEMAVFIAKRSFMDSLRSAISFRRGSSIASVSSVIHEDPSRQLLFSDPLKEKRSYLADAPKSLSDVQPIKQLDLLDQMVARIAKSPYCPDFSKVTLVANQHILETTATLFESYIKLGVKPANIYLAGKFYSTSPIIYQQMVNLGINVMPNTKPQQIGRYAEHIIEANEGLWRWCLEGLKKKKDTDTVVVVDDGFRCVENMPPRIAASKYKMAFVEQTRAGFYSQYIGKFAFPHIAVALSAAKKQLESPHIANAILNRITQATHDVLEKKMVCGVIGNGAIGHALAEYLLKTGHQVQAYDPNPQAFDGVNGGKFFRAGNILDVIMASDYIFGCSGQDITKDLNLLETLSGNKTFISCSSENREFSELINMIALKINQTSDFLLNPKLSVSMDPLSDITFANKNKGRIRILNGGFPINFDRRPWNVPCNDIALTQGLMLAGTVQAISQAKALIDDGKTINKAEIQKLDPFAQRFVVDLWRKLQQPRHIIGAWHDDISWIQEHSEGDPVPNRLFIDCFSAMTHFVKPKI